MLLSQPDIQSISSFYHFTEYATPQLHLLLRDSLVRTEDHAGGDGRRKPGRAVFPQGLAIFLVFEKEDQHQIFRNI